jgi:hypothetical protein
MSVTNVTCPEIGTWTLMPRGLYCAHQRNEMFRKLCSARPREKATPAMQRALHAYTYSHYWIINVLVSEGGEAALALGGDFLPYTSGGRHVARGRAVEQAMRHVGALDAYFSSNSPVTDAWMTLHQGIRHAGAGGVPSGTFVSATTCKRIARGFAGKNGAVLRLHVPPGTPFAIGVENEREVILPRTVKWVRMRDTEYVMISCPEGSLLGVPITG